MKKQIQQLVYFLANLFAALLLLLSCEQNDCHYCEPPVQGEEDTTWITVNASTKGASLRSIYREGNEIVVAWEGGRFDLNTFFIQDGKIYKSGKVRIYNNNVNSASFYIAVPEGINLLRPHEIVGVVGKRVVVKNNSIWVSVEAHGTNLLKREASNRLEEVPIWFKTKVETYSDDPIQVTFEHLGALAVLEIKNSSTKPLQLAGISVLPVNKDSLFYEKGALPFTGDEDLPYLNLLSTDNTIAFFPSKVDYPSFTIEPKSIEQIGFWLRPKMNLEKTPRIEVALYDAEKRAKITSENHIPSRAALKTGRAYLIYAEFNGEKLELLNKSPLPEVPLNQPRIYIEQRENISSIIEITLGTPDQTKNSWIDLNNNQVLDEGDIFLKNYPSNQTIEINIPSTSPQITIYGEINVIKINRAKMVDISDIYINTRELHLNSIQQPVNLHPLSKCKAIYSLYYTNSNITSLELPQINSLRELYLYSNGLSIINLANVPNLIYLYASSNNLSEIDLAVLKDIEFVNLKYNKLEYLDISSLSKLCMLFLGRNKIRKIKFGTNPPTSNRSNKGHGYWIGLDANNLNSTELNEIYNDLRNGLPNPGIDVSENPGVNEANHFIAEEKGWTVYK